MLSINSTILELIWVYSSRNVSKQKSLFFFWLCDFLLLWNIKNQIWKFIHDIKVYSLEINKKSVACATVVPISTWSVYGVGYFCCCWNFVIYHAIDLNIYYNLHESFSRRTKQIYVIKGIFARRREVPTCVRPFYPLADKQRMTYFGPESLSRSE